MGLVADEDLKPGMVRQLEVDKRLTVPTRTHIRFLVTGQDVLHCFSIPSLGLKTDATPGRITVSTPSSSARVFSTVSARSFVAHFMASCPSFARLSHLRLMQPTHASG